MNNIGVPERLIISPIDPISEDFNIFAGLLIANGICNKNHLKNYLSNRKEKKNIYLYDIEDLAVNVLESNLADEKKIKPIFEEIMKHRSKFGRIGIENGFMNFEQVQKALKNQKVLLEKHGHKFKLGLILSEIQNVLNKDDLKSILDHQKEKQNEISKIINSSVDKILSSGDFSSKKNKQKAIEELMQYTCEISSYDIDLILKEESNECLLKEEKVSICISRNKMEAQILNLKKGTKIYELKEEISKKGIIFGVISQEELEDFIQSPTYPFTVAKGKVPTKTIEERIMDKEGEYIKKDKKDTTFLVSKDLEKGNYFIPDIINKNKIIRIKSPAKKGANGYNIFGELIESRPIPEPKPVEKKIIDTDCFEIFYEVHEESNTVFECIKTKKEGFLCIDEFGEVSIKNHILIKEDVFFKEETFLFGKEANCNIHIMGYMDKAYVSCRDLNIEDYIKDSTIIANSVKANKNITQSNITTNENLNANVLENCEITADGEINISKNIIQSSINYPDFLKNKDILKDDEIIKKNFLLIDKINCNIKVKLGLDHDYIVCKDLTVNKEIKNSTIIANNINSKDHIMQSKIVAKGILEAFVLEFSQIITNDKINIAKMISNCNVICDSLKTEKIFDSKIIAKNNVWISSEARSSQEDMCEIKITSSDIFIINQKIEILTQIEPILKELESIIDIEQRQKKIFVEYKKQLNDSSSTNITKDKVILITKNYKEKKEEKMKLLNQFSELKIPELINVEIKEENFLIELRKIVKKYKVDLLLIEQKFNESRLKPVVKIKKIFGNFVVKGLTNGIELTNNIYETNIYEEKIANKDGTYTTKLVLRK